MATCVSSTSMGEICQVQISTHYLCNSPTERYCRESGTLEECVLVEISIRLRCDMEIIYMCVHTYIYVHIYAHVHIYEDIYREIEIERKKEERMIDR